MVYLIVLFLLASFVAGLLHAGGTIFVLGVCIILWYYTIRGLRYLSNRYYEKG